MNDIKAQFLFYLTGIWRRRWLAIGVAWLVCVLGWIGVAFIPNQYQSTARIYVDTDTLLAPLLKGMAVDVNTSRQVEIMQRTLLSRPNMEAVMRATDLDLRARTPEERESLIKSLERRTTIRAEGARNLFSLEFTDESPELARRVIQSLITLFIESNVGVQRRDMEKARSFIDGQISQYEKLLKESEERLAAFKQQYRHLLPANLGGDQAAGSALERARSAVATTRKELEEASIRRNAMVKQLSTIPRHYTEVAAQGVVGQGPKPMSEIDLRVQAAQQNLEALLLRFTDQHPDVIASKRTLDALKRQKEEFDRTDKSGEQGNRAIYEKKANPVYEQIQLKLSEIEISVELLQRRLSEQNTVLAKFEAEAETIPLMEAQYADLNRDYGILKKNYLELLERRESARLSQEVDAKADKVQFRVIDPPTVPLAPRAPNRPLFLTAVMAVGVGAGVLLALLLAQLDDSFRSLRQLRESFSLPILGSVSRIVSARERHQKTLSVVTFSAACVALSGIYGAVIMINLLDLKFTALRGVIDLVR